MEMSTRSNVPLARRTPTVRTAPTARMAPAAHAVLAARDSLGQRAMALLLVAVLFLGTALGTIPSAFGSTDRTPPAFGSTDRMPPAFGSTETTPPGLGSADRTPPGLGLEEPPPRSGPPEGFGEVVSLPVGDGPGELGIIEGPELEPWGPSAFAIDDEGRFHVVDGVNGRILAVSGNGEVLSSVTWQAPVVCPVDIAIVDGRTFVLDLPAQPPAVHELDGEGRPVDTWEIPAHYTDHGVTGLDVALDRRGGAGIRLEIAGTWHAPLVSRGLALPSRLLPTTASGQIVRVPAAAASRVAVERGAGGSAFFADKEWSTGRSASVTALRRGRPAATMNVRSRAALGAVRFLDVDERGNAYVFAEDLAEGVAHGVADGVAEGPTADLAENPAPTVRAFVKRYRSDGTPQAAFEIPVDRFRTHPERPTRIAPDGNAYLLVPGAESVSILRAEWQDDRSETLPEPDKGFVPAERYSPTTSSFDAGSQDANGALSSLATWLRSSLAPETANAAWTRINANDRAWSYVRHRWYCNRRNYSTRNGSARPRYITSQNRYYNAVPYCWGGFDTLATYNRAMSAGHSAGDINCTGGKRAGTAGVDCSGFLSRLWGLGSKRSTHTLTHVSYPVSKSRMRLGDAYIRPGSHCMFFRYYVTGGAQVFESTKTNRYDRVVTMTRTNSALSNYGGYRYRNW